MRPHVIVNARAAKFVRDPGRLRGMVEAAPGASIHATDSFEALAAACAAIAQDDPSLVVLCGGDGSAMAGVTHLLRAYGDRPLPTICLAPGGHSCTVARNWGPLRRDPRRHLAEVLSLASSGRLREVRRPTLRVEEADGTSRVGFIFGTGLVASFFEAFYERGGGGYGQASHMIARIVFGSFVGGPLARRVLTPMPCTLSIEGRPLPNPAFTLIVCAVVKDLGLRLRVPHRAAEDPSRPHLVASSLGLSECGLQYPRVLRGRPLIDGRTVDRLVEEFDVLFSTDPGAYVLDGDLLHTSRVTVRAGPEVRMASLPG